MAEPRGRILNVDDYGPARYARSELLRRSGYQVIEAGTGTEALRIVAEHRPDLVLLDVNLPDLSGFEVCRRIREQLGTLTVPIVHVSSTFVNERAHELAFEGGSDAYLTEPLEPPVLLATVQALLRLQRAEAGVRSAGRRWQVTFDAIGSGICLLGADGVIVQCNSAFARLMDRAAERIVGTLWTDLWRAVRPAEAWASLVQLDQQKLDAPRDSVDLSWNDRWYRVVVNPVGDGETVGGFVCVVTDITVERQAAEARAALLERQQAAREQAEAANRAKDEFLAMLAHELRNPLDVIASAVRVLDAIGSDQPQAVRTRQVLHRQLRQLGRLVDDLLDVARVTTGKISLARMPVNLADVVHRCLDTLTDAAQADRHRITVDAGTVWVDGDQSRVEQVVTNLVSNAMKYTPAGGSITITVGGDGQTARLAVSDTGVGIAPQILEHVFDLFVQGAQSLDRAEGGLGIGLTLVRRLVEMHGGTVSATSEGPGRGSTFVVELPQIPAPRAVQSETGESKPAVAARRILIVEDNEDSREMLRYLLKLAGHEVREATSGPTGLEALVEWRPEVALIDLGLPGFDGYELARRARATEEGARVRLVALTGYGLPEDRRRSRDAGFDTHLVKPVDPAQLAAVISAGEEQQTTPQD